VVESWSPADPNNPGWPHRLFDEILATVRGGVAYVAAMGLPLLLSSERTVFVFGVIVLAGLVVAYAVYWEALISVWCFFAAAASVAILSHFEWSRRSLLNTAGASPVSE